MKILVSGAGGMVGKALVPRLRQGGHDVRTLSRSGGDSASIAWDVQRGTVDRAELDLWSGPDAFIHLAGENIAARRWIPEQKRRISESRIEATERLVSSFLSTSGKLRVFIGASAVGIYGNRGDEVLTERSARGTGFLAEVAEGWESAATPLAAAGVRVVHLRFGMILSRDAGALPKMLPLFRAGLGARLGNGDQWVSWISIADSVRIIEFALTHESARGPYNAVAPEPSRNADFTRHLAKTLHRPAILSAPAFVLRLALGEMADALLLSSQRAVPERLLAEGFQFTHANLAAALQHILYRN